MSSLIEGYNYDIFISYRQKDNKGDKWVSEFVEALKTELESTFKEEIRVYFDINPHDGLLETHDVDESLKEKLKCLIFIPIISRTYCDPKAFAWEHEFKAFVEQASKDEFGLKVRLPNGNVASRVLPVVIHDLDVADIKECELVLGGVMRGIEFIYKEPGVNRPLNHDDDSKENLNRTKYRNQINKVANAIKDIISGIKDYDQPANEISEGIITLKTVPLRKKSKTKLLVWSVVILALFTVGYYSISEWLKSSRSIEKSIAVLPFVSFSDDVEQAYFSDAMLDEILDRLCRVGDLQVSSRTSSMSYKNTNLPLKQIGEELGVSNILEGSVRKIDNRVRIIVQLVDAKKDEHLWSETFDRDYADIFNLTSEIAETIAKELKVVITAQERILIDKVPTENMEAYEDYVIGRHMWRNFTPEDLNIAMQYFERAKEKDNEYALAYLGISDVWFGFLQLGYIPPGEDDPMEKYMTALTQARELDSTLAEVHYSLGNMYASFMWDWKSSEQEYEKALSINPNYSDVYAAQSNLFAAMGRTEESLETIEMAMKLDPQNTFNKVLYGISMYFARRYDESIHILEDALENEPNNFLVQNILPCAFHMTGEYHQGLNSWKSFVTSFYNNDQIDYDQIIPEDFPLEAYVNILNNLADTLVEHVESTQFDMFNIALLYACAGDKEKMYDMLDKCYEDHNPNFLFLLNPCFDFIREESRFMELCRKIDLPT